MRAFVLAITIKRIILKVSQPASKWERGNVLSTQMVLSLYCCPTKADSISVISSFVHQTIPLSKVSLARMVGWGGGGGGREDKEENEGRGWGE